MASNLDHSKFAQRLQGKLLVEATVNQYQLLAPTLARVLVTVTGHPKTVDDLRSAVRAAFQPEASPILSSFRLLEEVSQRTKVAVGFITPNRETKPYVKANHLKQLASNVLMDTNDESIWDLKRVGDQMFMCRQTTEDLSELLALARVRDVSIDDKVELSNLVGSIASEGEYVTYATVEGDMGYGYCLASSEDHVLVSNRNTGRIDKVDIEQVVTVSHMGGEDKHLFAALAKAGQKKPKVEAESGDIGISGDWSNLHNYYKAVYGYDPEYFAKFEEIINAHGF